MKNPKTFLFLSIIIAVLILGVAYAALSREFTITADATVAPDGSNFKVKFVESPINVVATKTDKVGDVTAVVNSETAAKITIPAGVLSALNDTVEVTYTITNFSEDLTATLSNPITVTASGKYVTWEARYGANGTELEPGESTTVVVTAKLTKSYVGDASNTPVTESATIKFTATASEYYN